MSDFAKSIRKSNFKLKSHTMVEASAGTGKTYNIQNIYLRLILEENLSVEEILVVTFTEAATHELRERVRNVLSQARDYLSAKKLNNVEDQKRISEIVDIAKPKDNANDERLGRIKLALMNFDNAAIFTIHGFCKRILDHNSFECGHDPEAEMVADESMVIFATCMDWWRGQTYQNEDFPEKVPFESLKELQSYLCEFLKRPDARLIPESRKGGSKQWTKLASDLNEAKDAYDAALKNDDKFGKPNVAAKRIQSTWVPKLIEIIKTPHLDRYALRSLLKEMQKDYRGAKVKRGKAQPNKSLEAFTIEETEASLSRAIDAISSQVLGEMSKILNELSETVRRKVKERGVLTYNDLLRNVSEALKEKDTSEQLTKVLRNEFKAAIIDEFQDTDAIQYSIFDILFKRSNTPLYLIGDPKQAIYGFRGGDVFTYYEAKKNLGEKSLQRLGTNFRSEESLVAAINELFKDGATDDERSFINKNIQYDGSLKANEFSKENSLLLNGKRDNRPLKLRKFVWGQKRAPGQDSDEAKRIYADTADEIVRLIGSNECLIANKPIQPSDIAVLVCTHKEANYIYDELKNRNVNAILQSTGNVFDTEDAREMAIIIQAMLNPSDISTARGALLTSIMPCSTEELQRFNDENASEDQQTGSIDSKATLHPVTFEGWLDIIKTAGGLWIRRSFIESFRYLSDHSDMRNHVVRLHNGEQRLTNILHLAELIHKKAIASQHGPIALAKWLNIQLNADTRDEQEEFKLRLASDDDAVKIMTIFTSKGLQFPIVFVPTLWRKSSKGRYQRGEMLTYHANNQVVMNMDNNDENGREAVESELLQENLRLVYVALTRAIHRTYVTNVMSGNDETHALQRLIGKWEKRSSELETSHIETTNLSFEDSTTEPLRKDKENNKSVDLKTYECRQGKKQPKVDKLHGHTSFSSLEPATRNLTDFKSRDIDAINETTDEDESGLHTVAEDIFSIPGNARTGNCWHEILENINFQSPSEEINQIIDINLDRYGICKGPTAEITNSRKNAVHKMIQDTLDANLNIPELNDSFHLRDIPMDKRQSEMEFYFSLKQNGTLLRTSSIKSVLENNWKDDQQKTELFLPSLNSWDKGIPLGFMNGFIDLVCCHNNRFYILDWKSNKRSGQKDDFKEEGIWDEMARNSYFLQYLLYSVALDGFLTRELKGYNYQDHFGGVFYVFLRGVEKGSPNGIFADRPTEKLVIELANLLTRDEGYDQ